MHCETCNTVYFERFSVVLRHFPKAFCAKPLLVTKSSFLRKCASTLVFGFFNISKTNRINDDTQYPCGTYVNFDIQFKRKKAIIHFFLGTKRKEQETYYTYFLRYTTQGFFKVRHHMKIYSVSKEYI